ncbi:MAG: hypothetical protein M3072_14990 [Candidatus Dormibacteraeota bacterium]|nr:hypothetical protein [Candidatus Dormibacteraeota bacterium]
MKMLRRMRRVIKWAGFGLMVAAISQEMAKPEAERTWQGHLLGLVPYDFRPPTWQRLRAAYWNPADHRLFTDRVLGVGWALNLFRARQLLAQGFDVLMGQRGRIPAPIRRVVPGAAAAARSRRTQEPTATSRVEPGRQP